MKLQKAPKLFNMLVMLVYIAVATSCTNLQSTITSFIAYRLANMPSPIPSFIGNLRPSPGSKLNKTDMICVDLNGKAMWEPGDKVEDAEYDKNYWSRRLTLTVDGKSILFTDKIAVYAGGVRVSAYDEQKRFIGSYVAGYFICFPVVLPKGWHIATVKVATTSGVTQVYTWSFHTE